MQHQVFGMRTPDKPAAYITKLHIHNSSSSASFQSSTDPSLLGDGRVDCMASSLHVLIRPNEALLAAVRSTRILMKHYPASIFNEALPHLWDEVKNFVNAALIPMHREGEELCGLKGYCTTLLRAVGNMFI